MLAAAGVPCETIAHGADETAEAARFFEAGGAPAGLAEALALAKLEHARRMAPPGPVGPSAGDVVLAADQVVIFDGEAQGKPASAAAARKRLGTYAGRRQRLVSAAAIGWGQSRRVVQDEAEVTLRPLAAAEIDAYVARAEHEALSSAAGYAIEGLGGNLIHAVRGDYSAALGLPLFAVLAVLREAGVAPLVDQVKAE